MPTLSTLTIDVVTNTSKFSKGLRTVTTGLGVMAAGAIYAFKQFEDSQQVANQTAAVIKSTGGAANVTAGEVTGLADALSKKAAIDDELIASGENVLLTFKNISNEAGKGNDVFNRATKATLDLSVAMGQDMKSSAVQVGKALNDPIAGITALTRVGVTFTEQQKAQIAKLVESGNTLKAQKIILQELTSEFGGSAAAQATASGRMSVAFGNLAEAVGGVVAPMIEKLVGWLTRLADWFTALPEGMQTFITVGVAAAATVALATKAFGLLSPAINGAVIAIKFLTLALSTNPYLAIIAATIAIAILIVKNWDTIKEFLLKVWDGIKAVAGVVWDKIKDFIVDPVKTAVDWVIDRFRDVKERLSDIWNGIKETAITVWNGIVEAIKGAVNLAIEAINFLIRNANRVSGAFDFVGGPFVNWPDIPEISSLHHGGTIAESGIAVVHRGETVIPAGAGAGGITIVNHFHGDVTGEEIVRKVRDGLLRLQARNATTGL